MSLRKSPVPTRTRPTQTRLAQKSRGLVRGRRQAEQMAARASCAAREVGVTSKAGMSFRFRVMGVATARSIKDSRLWEAVKKSRLCRLMCGKAQPFRTPGLTLKYLGWAACRKAASGFPHIKRRSRNGHFQQFFPSFWWVDRRRRLDAIRVICGVPQPFPVLPVELVC